jgi:hypothetical protein
LGEDEEGVLAQLWMCLVWFEVDRGGGAMKGRGGLRRAGKKRERGKELAARGDGLGFLGCREAAPVL